jgi:hypothetical protein
VLARAFDDDFLRFHGSVPVIRIPLEVKIYIIRIIQSEMEYSSPA